ncbi:MAG TPA: BON domain-containing protein [Bryobacteraceae bacterium]|jgi:osmotically-inducible protein OsmY
MMKALKLTLTVLSVAVVGAMAGCSTNSTKAPDVSNSLRTSLDQAGFKDVSVSQDRDKGVVTLGGHVPAEGDKAQAESIAKSLAAPEVVSDQIEVLPPGAEHEAKDVNSDLDKGIEHNLDAALIENKLHDGVSYSVKNQVVTLTGEVDSQGKRARAQNVATAVLNVQQVVNELQVKRQKASSSN